MSLFCFIGRSLKTAIPIVVLFLLSVTHSVVSADTDLPSRLQTMAEQFVFGQMVIDPTTQVEVKAATIDNRRIPNACTDHITTSLAGNGQLGRNTVVRLKCEQEPAWEIFVPVRVRVLKPFVTVTRPVARDTTLSADMLKVDFMDEVMVRGDNFTGPDELVGSRIKRDLRPGQPVRKNEICVVCRNDTVQIEAATSVLSIKTLGKALQDGSFGDLIRVENLRSHRQISAVVSAVGIVRVEM